MTSPGVVYQILRIKAKITEMTRGARYGFKNKRENHRDDEGDEVWT